MGEHICHICDYMNSHLYIHEHSHCEQCGTNMIGRLCDSCNVPFKRPSKEMLNVMDALKKGDVIL